jgi:hypothetical protein
MNSRQLWLLELVINTENNGYVNEPIGIYTSREKAILYSKKVTSGFESKAECNVLPIFLDEAPPILDFIKQTKKDALGEGLYSLYEIGAFEQMVEADGSFSYSLKKDFQTKLENVISKYM